METKIANEKLNPVDYGLKENQAQQIEQAFMPKISERDGLKQIYSEILKKEINPETCREAKNCRLKLVKVRIGIAEIHKSQKAFFLAAGRFVDAWKNKETLPITQMEQNLQAVEEHFERIEAEKIKKLQEQRAAEIAKFQDEGAFISDNLGTLEENVYQNYLLGVKTAWQQKKDAEKAAKEAEEKRIAEEKAEQERIRKENERLKKEAELAEIKAEAERKEHEEKERKEKAAHEAALKKEREEKKRIQRELEAKAEAERKEREEKEAALQAELSKGDAEKVKDLIAYFEAGKTKFSFKSKKNQKMYTDVGILIDKIINHIQK